MFTPDNVDRARTMLANLARKGKAYAQGITELELKVGAYNLLSCRGLACASHTWDTA